MEYIYVFEGASGSIKVGRTASLAKRLHSHMSTAAAWTPGGIDQIWTGTVSDSAEAERRILATLNRLPYAELRTGRELFTGISFLEVVSIAASVCRAMPVDVHPMDLLDRTPEDLARQRVPQIFRDVVAIFDVCDEDELRTTDLLERLAVHDPERYSGMESVSLANGLRPMGLAPRKMHGGKARGYSRSSLYDAVFRLSN